MQSIFNAAVTTVLLKQHFSRDINTYTRYLWFLQGKPVCLPHVGVSF